MQRMLSRVLTYTRVLRRSFQTGDLIFRYQSLTDSKQLVFDEKQLRLVKQFEKMIFLLSGYQQPVLPKFEICRVEDSNELSVVRYFSDASEGESLQASLQKSDPNREYFFRPLLNSSFFSSARIQSKKVLPQMNLPRLPTEVHYSVSDLYVPQANSATEHDANLHLKPATLYVWGNVGTGKTLLMNHFYEAIPLASKQNFHFHDFMKKIHSDIHVFKQTHKTSEGDAIVQVSRAIGEQLTLLCFDEFQVNDIADALILGRVFETLYKSGTVIVSTSNQSPDDLYAGGLNRHIFFPFISLLKHYSRVFPMDSSTDYRYFHYIPAENSYLYPVTPRNEERLKSLLPPTSQRVVYPIGLSRSIPIDEYAKGIGRIPFSTLCEEDRSVLDYISVSQEFHTLAITNIPKFCLERPFVVSRFITLIDHLYDRKIKVVFLAQDTVGNADPPLLPHPQIDGLFSEILQDSDTGPETYPLPRNTVERNRDFALERLKFQCVRTKSRMYEMTSQSYGEQHKRRFQFA